MSSHPAAEASTQTRFLEPLKELNAVRIEWAVNPRAQRKAVWICAAMGAWGILSGYAVFLLLWGKGAEGPLKFLIGLLVAAGVAFIAETMRELIQHGSAGEGGRGAGSRIVVTILMLAVFELFVMAYHEATGIAKDIAEGNLNLIHALRTSVLGPALSNAPSAWWDVGALAGLWLIVGALLAWCLACVIVHATGKRSQQLRFGVKVGGMAGVIAAPLGVLAYILIVRAIGSIVFIITQHKAWEQNLGNIFENKEIPAIGKFAVLPVRFLDSLWHVPIFGHAIVPLLLLGLVLWCRKTQK